jgi:hypothetical protein
MAKKEVPAARQTPINAQPRLHQRAGEIQAYGTVSHGLPLELEEPVRLEMTEQLNLLLADTMTLRDLYKKSHWQVAGGRSISFIFCSISITRNRSRSLTRLPSASSCWEEFRWPWLPTSPRPRVSSVRRADGKKCRSSFHAFSARIRSSSVTAENLRNVPPSWEMPVRMTWWSAMFCERTNFRHGFSPNIWSMFPW